MTQLQKHTIVIILVLLALWGITNLPVHAQDDVQYDTTFQTSCYSDLTPTDAHIHVKYTADQVEHYTITTDATGTSIPADLTTEPGTHELGWVLYTVDAQITVTFTTDTGIEASLPIIISEIQEGECTPVTPYTPDPDAPVVTTPACPYSAVNQATGETYCYVPTQFNLSGAVVPIPPASSQ